MNGAIIDDFVTGRWRDPESGETARSPVSAILIAASLDGREGDLIVPLGLGRRLAVVADEHTVEVMGRRVACALKAVAQVDLVVLKNPHADIDTVGEVQARTKAADGLIAVGSGTVNDLCKHATHLDGRPYAVFGTAASMNGYVTGTASITEGGFKRTLASHTPRGAFFDLTVMAAAPLRQTRAGFGDSICRTTAQVDWLMAHLLLGRRYMEGPYVLQAEDEVPMLDQAGEIAAGRLDSLAILVRMLVLGGLGVVLPGTSDPGSQGEHLISHYIDMLAGPRHPGSLHGEQVGVAAMTMNRLQHALLSMDAPPRLSAMQIDRMAMSARFGALAPQCMAEFEGKAMGTAATDRLNAKLADFWPDLRRRLRAVLLPQARMRQAMDAIGAPMRAADIRLAPALYREAVLHAREIRNRYTFLDIAADGGLLEAFAAGEG